MNTTNALWFMYCLDTEAKALSLYSDGPGRHPVLMGDLMCSMGVWENDREIAHQVSQAYQPGVSAYDAVLSDCKEMSELTNVNEFYIWDDAEGGWWNYCQSATGAWNSSLEVMLVKDMI